MQFHFYCPACFSLLKKTGGSLKERSDISPKCSICGKTHTGKGLAANGCFFVTLPLAKQLETLLSNDVVKAKLLESLEVIHGKVGTGGANSMADITDGSLYRRQRTMLKCGKYDITVMLNSDGSPVFTSSSYTIWPVQLVINELPFVQWWCNVVVSGLWYGTSHPRMTLVMQSFVEQMQPLLQRGITWSAGGLPVKTKVYCICSVADAPARATRTHHRHDCCRYTWKGGV